MAQLQQPQHQHEFLPLCDVLFNIISLASYFCDVVFDLAMVYALANHPATPTPLFPLSIVLVISSLVISQIVSVRWYLWGARGKLTVASSSNHSTSTIQRKLTDWTVLFVMFLHTTQLGVLWRYFKLFIPVDLTYVKHEVRELCVLRLIHAFCEAAPMLLLQLYLLSIGIMSNASKEIKRDISSDKLAELTAVSAGLSLWNVCWAVASFSKGAARLRNLERLVLTWLGVLAQLAWRLGTVSARVGALVAYASLYGGQWLLVVLALHWLSMFTWLLLTPDGLFHGGERLSVFRKTFLASMLAFVYVFAYVNLHETNHRQKMMIFYTVMFLENSLLTGIWVVGVSVQDTSQPRPIVLVLVLIVLFFGGLFFMGLYYRFFHVRRLRYESGGRMNGSSVVTTLSNQDINDEKQAGINANKKNTNDITVGLRKVKLSNSGIPGVFNCRFANPTVVSANRKKKKPTTFVPPPVTTFPEVKHWNNSGNNSRQLIPFWKRPISATDNHDDEWNNDGKSSASDIQQPVVTLNVNLIREKLREKKQQQLRELRAIQEEIKEGKLVPPPSASTSSFSSSLSQGNQQPPPNTKLHRSPQQSDGNLEVTAWPPIKMHCLPPPVPLSPYHSPMYTSNVLWKSKQAQPDTPEILLAPRCLPHHFDSHWTTTPQRPDHLIDTPQISSKGGGGGEDATEISDIEDGSQVSLPRSYTLPRQFKYNSNNLSKERPANVNNKKFYLPSTNSSDGDVDSADNEEDSELQGHPKHVHRRLNQEDDLQRRFTFVNGEAATAAAAAVDRTNSNLDTGVTSMGALGCYLNNSCSPRVNQLFKAKVKHETKL